MGQRLVATIKNNGRDLAKIYYHWSAYTVSSLIEAKDIVNCIYNHSDETEKELQLRLIRFCEKNGGGIDGGGYSEEFKRIQAMFPNEKFKTENISRNCGLIALSEDGMDDIQSWSEGDLDIIIDEDIIINEVCWGYESLEDYKESMDWDEGSKNMKLEDIPEIEYDLSEIDINEIDDVIDALRKVNGFVCRFGNEIYEIIA